MSWEIVQLSGIKLHSPGFDDPEASDSLGSRVLEPVL